MKVLTSEDYVQKSLKREISGDYEAFPSPTFIKCPHCSSGIVLAKTIDEKKKFSIILDDFVLLIPEDETPEKLERIFNDIVRPGFFQFIAEQKKKEPKQ
jgi:hypothetical protein